MKLSKVEDVEQNMDATADKQSIDVKSAEAKKNLEAKKLADAKKQQETKNLQKLRRQKKPESRQKSMLPRQAANTTRMFVFEPEPIVLLVFPR